MTHHLSWLEASTIGLLQGVSELFPVSSLGHSVLIPAMIGGTWARDLDVSAPESPYLAFIVGLHVATALALIAYFWRDWLRIIGGIVTSVRYRRVESPDERLAWLLILATIPVGITGLLLEHTFRTVLAKPNPAAVFLIVNGFVLLAAERFRRASEARTHGSGGVAVVTVRTIDERVSTLRVRDAVAIGAAQIAALAPGISRSGVAMAAGLLKGLDHEEAARFSFLLATPVILAAGALKLPDLAGPLGEGIRGQVLLGSAFSFVGAYASVAFLSRYFRSNSLRPFGLYCIAFGIVAAVLVNR
jgi:undecaprenyl-diphosphatase